MKTVRVISLINIGMIAVLILVSLNCLGQYQPGRLANGIIPNVMPVSPEAASLGKFGDWPVSNYTGTTNVSIPFYKIETGGFELPVQLSYHTGGVKIDDVPSWVGTGWTLNAGGVITRTIVGMADEETHGFVNRNMRGEALKNSYNLNDLNDFLFLRQVSRQQIDTEPDIFYYNFAGMSGKFYFDKNGNFQSIPVNTLKLLTSPITTSPSNNLWKIADQQGNVFCFGESTVGDVGAGMERTVTRTLSSEGQIQLDVQPTSAWYLTSIYVKNQADTIHFDYVDKNERYSPPSVFSFRQLTNAGSLGNLNQLIPGYEQVLRLGVVSRDGVAGGTLPSTTIMVGGNSQLSKIRWSSGEIQFAADIVREDIVGKNLTQISLFNKKHEKVKEAKLSFAYKGQRYYLDSLIEYGSTNERKCAHGFLYESPENLPPRNTFSQDHWGYFNGRPNQHLLPAQAGLNTSVLNADREPDEQKMKIGSLKKIIYPTGGTTEFRFEANKYDGTDVPGGGNPTQEVVRAATNVSASDPQSLFPYSRVVELYIPPLPFQPNSTLYVSFRNYSKPPDKRTGILPIVKLERLTADGYILVGSWDAYDNFSTAGGMNSNNTYNFDITKSVPMTSGQYRLTADLRPELIGLGDPQPVIPSFYARLEYSTYGFTNTPVPTNPVAGGLRIKEIINTLNGNETSHKLYEYDLGKLLIYPKYKHEYGEDIFPYAPCYYEPNRCGSFCGLVLAKYNEAISTSQSVLGFTQGSPVGYINVREKNINPSGIDNGYISYNYSFKSDDLNETNFDSYWENLTILNNISPLNNNEYKRGLLLNKDVYRKAENGNYIKVSTLNNVYEFNDSNTDKRYNVLKSLRVRQMRQVNYPCGDFYVGGAVPSGGFAPDYAYSFYNVFTGWVQAKVTSETIYDKNGANPVTSRTEFTYDNPAHLQATTSTKATSSGVAVESYMYPHDMVAAGIDPSGVYQGMVAKNMISNPIQISNTVNGHLTLRKTNYFQPLSEIYVPQSIEERNTATGLNEVRIRFHEYDHRGNLSSYSQEQGIKVNYLWSYNGQYPAIEIRNTDFLSIRNVLGAGTIRSFSDSSPDIATINGIVGTLKQSLPGIQINSATFKPLYGTTSRTDTKGMTTYFDYDPFQRLKSIKDQNGNIVKSYQYRYQAAAAHQ